ncbi:MAG: biopolymer transport protein ExbD [Myxococcota bacterium]
MFDKYRKAQEEAPELNLIPVMNLMVVLIPMLLLGAAFFHISVIPTSIASDGSGGDPSLKVTMKLDITPAGLFLSGHSGDPTINALTLQAQFPITDGNIDLKGLQDRLESIKAAHPASDTLVLTPFEDMPYQVLIQIVDVVREKLVPMGDGLEPKRVILFPVTVFARPGMEIPEPGAEGTLEGQGVPAEAVAP